MRTEAGRIDANRSRILDPLEVWGGVECTVARIGDGFRNQVVETGHHDRLDDLDRVAALGIRTLRYPFLWETISPDTPDDADFVWHDERMRRLAALEIRPIAGLCHHGSGPRYTNLLDPRFPDLLARHAGRVAERYPQLSLYTPVNEPLTTARFSGLYGHWYPHETGYRPFLGALVNQCKATVLAMRAIRRISPDAQLVQTDDLGKTFSTPALAGQAEHENQRRWLAYDLLCGMVDRHHPWWSILLRHGIDERDLDLFLEADAAPDVIGINHYLTSERYLDERLKRYPEHHWGGNGTSRYADAEAVRMPLDPADLGPLARLREAWERYRRPIAVTEVHHGCTRDEQLRWLLEVWQAAQILRQDGADVRAVTVWSLFGTVDWSSLLTHRQDHYEPGLFDVRGPEPRRTALADATASLVRRATFQHPVLDRAGWWKRDTRFYRAPAGDASVGRLGGPPRHLLVTGASGTLGRAFSRICNLRGLDHVLASRADMDIGDRRSVRAALARHRPWAVVNAAGYVRVADAEGDPERCFRENAEGALILAQACADLDIPFVTISSDLVFDGRLGRPYRESDPVTPRSVYGASKAKAEADVLEACGRALVVRTSAFFGPWDPHNFPQAVLRDLAAGRTFVASADRMSPTYVPDLVHEVLNLLIDGETGLWNVVNPGSLSWWDFARTIAEKAGFDPGLVAQPPDGEVRDTSLTSERGILLPPLAGAIDRFVRDSEVDWASDLTYRTAAE